MSLKYTLLKHKFFNFYNRKIVEERASNFPFKPYLIFNLSYGQEIDLDNKGYIKLFLFFIIY